MADPIGQLKVMDALLARYHVSKDAQKMLFLKDRVSAMLRDADPRLVVKEPDVMCMIRQLWGQKGYERMLERAKGTQRPEGRSDE